MTPRIRVSDTAILTLFLRRNSGMYARELALAANAGERLKRMLSPEVSIADIDREFGAYLVGRSRALDKVLRNHNIIELGAGFASRGLEVSDDPRMFYVETDQGPVIREKQVLVEHILGGPRPNLKFMPLDILDGVQLVAASQLFRGRGEVDMVLEGAFSYFPEEEKLRVLRCILDFLRVVPGRLVTTDIVDEAQMKKHEARRMELLGPIFRNAKFFPFASYARAQKTIGDIGFTIQRHRQEDLIPGISPRLISDEVWVMTPK